MEKVLSFRYFIFKILLVFLFSTMGISCFVEEEVNDTYYEYQWHLNNTGQLGASEGFDINAPEAWEVSKGNNVVIHIVDDGCNYNHEDLVDNSLSEYNRIYADYVDFENDAVHGTSVTGLICAAINDIGVVGVAPKAKFAVSNLINGESDTEANEADAMIRNKDIFDISNNSWGPFDNYGTFDAAPKIWEMAIDEGVATGRNGKGIIYVWSAGNGAVTGTDNSNYNGYVNYYGVIAVTSLNPNGTRAYYSEPGANIWLSTYSAGYTAEGELLGITSTDIMGDELGYGIEDGNSMPDLNYNNCFGGTSASAPIVSGVAALMLSVNPCLTWRDVKIILAESAVQVDAENSSWVENGAGYKVSYDYGFGSVDAYGAVTLAETWKNVGKLIVDSSSDEVVDSVIPDNDETGLSSSIDISGSKIKKIEYVEINVDFTHEDAGNLQISLTSPDGTESILAQQHTCLDENWALSSCGGFEEGQSFRFGSVRHLGEAVDGQWTLTVKDLETGETGTFNSWNLKFYGRKK